MSLRYGCYALLFVLVPFARADQTLTLTSANCFPGTRLECQWRNAGCTRFVTILKTSDWFCDGSCAKKNDPNTGCITKDCCAPSITVNDTCTKETGPTTTSVTSYIKPVCGLECRCSPAACF